MRIALPWFAMLVLAAHPAKAQTVTAFKTGEQTTGMTKQCFYTALGNAYTLTTSSVKLCPLTVQVRLPATPDTVTRGASPLPPPALTAFKTGEQTTGMTKQCFYSALGNSYTKTISSVELCPLSVQVRSPAP